MPEPQERHEPPEFLGPGYDLTAFRRDSTGGGLRWLATILAVAGGGMLPCMVTGIAPPVVHYPIHIEGPAALWSVGGASLFWSWIAILNWSGHARSNGRPLD